MSSPEINPVVTESVNPASGPDGQQQGSPPNAQGEAVTSSTKFDNLDEFKKKAPEVYDKMMLGIATNIVNEMKDHQERLKKMWRESSQNG